MLGGILAVFSAATFAFNNASVRRAVLTGSITQGMAITVPIGVPLFFIAATAVSLLGALALSVSTELVQSVLPLPEWAKTFLNWHWP